MIPSSFIQELLNRIDIVDVVSRYVQLKKGGANLLGLCPFHQEKSPSFTVSPSKQFYHCFGCGAHGTAIGFLIDYAGLGFIETVHELAKDVGMTVPDHTQPVPPAQQKQYEAKSLALSEVMDNAYDFYRQQLRHAAHAIDYLKKRGLTGNIAAKFGLGYAPENWDSLRQVFSDYTTPLLVEAGLVIHRGEANQQKYYDRFRDRIIFPIRNLKGQIIGFGGRILHQGEPKYLNSPETPLFQKGNELYGLFEARPAIRESGYVLVTEGYMDVVALAQLGFPQAVATLGTACTTPHLQKLLRHTDQVIFSFDGDAAGRKAARRALEISLSHVNDNKTIKFLFLPSQHDPDSFIREQGKEAFQRYILDAMPLSQFLLNAITAETDLHTSEGRARAQHNAKPLLQLMSPSALRLQIVRSLAQLTQSNANEIEILLELRKPVSTLYRPPLTRTKRPAPPGLVQQIIRLLIAHPALVFEFDTTSIEALTYCAPDPLLTHLIDTTQKIGRQATLATLAEHFREDQGPFSRIIAEVAADMEMDIQTARLELMGAIYQAKTKMIKDAMEKLAATGLRDEDARRHYRDLMQKQEQLRCEIPINLR